MCYVQLHSYAFMNLVEHICKFGITNRGRDREDGEIIIMEHICYRHDSVYAENSCQYVKLGT